MRFQSEGNSMTVFAVSGVNTISFAIEAAAKVRNGLYGFTVERYDPTEDERYTMYGYKVFRSVIPNPVPEMTVSTADHPVQSFLWDDFTAKPDRVYEYTFQPRHGTVKNLRNRVKPVTIRVRTEPLVTTDGHDVFFNRGVASSQAYVRQFGNKSPDRQKTEAKKKAALQWLTRDLDEAILRFIANAGKEDTLLCCFYEFHYAPVLEALAEAAKRIRELRIIIDAKKNETTDEDGNVRKSFPRTANLKAIKEAGIPDACIIRREANPSDIQHNKFMVLLKGKQGKPAEVWTGSTNISLGGLAGQTNVGHWVRDAAVAERFKAYWELLAEDPGSTEKDSRSEAARKKKAFRSDVEDLVDVPLARKRIRKGTTAVFSPRSGPGVLDLYVDLVDKADSVSCVTLAFGINGKFRDALKDNSPLDHITFLLLEKRDKPAKNSKTPYVAVNASNNVYKAWGSFIRDTLYRWARETNTRALGINRHVSYIHSKFLLRDPLGEDPIVVTGSANFSEASTNGNDENMLIIRGNRRVADIYFTEFNRLFNHYYFRSVTESAQDDATSDGSELFLKEKPEMWLEKYQPGKLKAKRLKVFTDMKGFTKL